MPMSTKQIPIYELTSSDLEDAFTWAALQGLELREVHVNPETLSRYNRLTFANQPVVLAGLDHLKKFRASGTTELKADKDLGEDEVKMVLVSKSGLPKPG